MKRKMELVRLLLMKHEGESVDLCGYSDPEIIYHLVLMIEARLLEGIVRRDSQGEPSGAVVFRLTWDGHDFLDALRNDSVWAHAREVMKKKGVELPFEVLKCLLLKLLKDMVGI